MRARVYGSGGERITSLQITARSNKEAASRKSLGAAAAASDIDTETLYAPTHTTIILVDSAHERDARALGQFLSEDRH
jgi:hypothetical protein